MVGWLRNAVGDAWGIQSCTIAILDSMMLHLLLAIILLIAIATATHHHVALSRDLLNHLEILL